MSFMKGRKYVNAWFRSIKNNQSAVLSAANAVRYYPAWKASIELGKNSLTDRLPWITFQARSFIQSLLTPESIVFEYGSGGSTIFYSKIARHVFSIEHDEEWFNQVKASLAEEGIANCDCVLVLPEPTPNLDGSPDHPTSYVSSSERYRGFSFYRYVTHIDSFPDGYFDFVAVDGRARPSCINHARSKIKDGGYVMLDNSEVSVYKRACQLLSGWEKHEFWGPVPYVTSFSRTSFWRRMTSSQHADKLELTS